MVIIDTRVNDSNDSTFAIDTVRMGLVDTGKLVDFIFYGTDIFAQQLNSLVRGELKCLGMPDFWMLWRESLFSVVTSTLTPEKTSLLKGLRILMPSRLPISEATLA